MGSSASKASRVATGASARKYPTRLPPTASSTPANPTNASQTTNNATPFPSPSTQQGPTVHPAPHASGTRSDAINLDASDPDFAQSLRTLGPVQPNPTLSPSSTFPSPGNPTSRPRAYPADPRRNPAVMVLESRARLQERADQEFREAGRAGHEGREFLDIYTIQRVLRLRDEQGKPAGEIERVLGLKKGVVGRLGSAGVVAAVNEVGRAEKGVDMQYMRKSSMARLSLFDPSYGVRTGELAYSEKLHRTPYRVYDRLHTTKHNPQNPTCSLPRRVRLISGTRHTHEPRSLSGALRWCTTADAGSKRCSFVHSSLGLVIPRGCSIKTLPIPIADGKRLYIFQGLLQGQLWVLQQVTFLMPKAISDLDNRCDELRVVIGRSEKGTFSSSVKTRFKAVR
nr:hypothetical protein CFP56_09011 [Quercus suber]